MTKTKLQIMREKNEELLRANINMHDALDLKSERIQELKKQLATAVEALENIKIAAKSLGDEAEYNYASEALAEIGDEDES